MILVVIVLVRLTDGAIRIVVVTILRLVRSTRLVVMRVGLVALLVRTVILAGLVLSLTLTIFPRTCPVVAI